MVDNKLHVIPPPHNTRHLLVNSRGFYKDVEAHIENRPDFMESYSIDPEFFCEYGALVSSDGASDEQANNALFAIFDMVAGIDSYTFNRLKPDDIAQIEMWVEEGIDIVAKELKPIIRAVRQQQYEVFTSYLVAPSRMCLEVHPACPNQ